MREVRIIFGADNPGRGRCGTYLRRDKDRRRQRELHSLLRLGTLGPIRRRVMTADGRLFKAGDTDYAFAIESISKVFPLALVIELIGSDAVRQKVGTSPTGLPFNSVMALELHSGKPMSPLVNAGAIATVSLVPGDSADACWGKILDMQSRFAGRPIALSDEVNQSEQTTNFHNRAIGWLLYSAGTCHSDPIRAVDVYTRQCSTLVTTTDLAVMDATLAAAAEPGGAAAPTANNPASAGRNDHGRPLHGIRGMGLLGGPSWQERGRWWYPRRAPGMLAIAAFSPPLDLRLCRLRHDGQCGRQHRASDAHRPAGALPEITMEGLDERSGDWAFEVGVPGKGDRRIRAAARSGRQQRKGQLGWRSPRRSVWT